jgi:hypothetical protein
MHAAAIEVSAPCAGDSYRPEVSGAARPRIDAIDAVRGALLVAITCSHALVNIDPHYQRLRTIAGAMLSGSVGFTTLSGLLVGWFAVVKREHFGSVVRRYRIHAARLVLVAHPILLCLTFPASHRTVVTYVTTTLFITDTFAVLFLVVVPAMPRIAPRTRLIAGASLLAAGATMRLWVPDSFAGELLLDAVSGSDPSRPHVLASAYGLLPIAGMFLIGGWLGDRLALAQAARDERRFIAELDRARTYAIAIGTTLVGAWFAVHQLGAHALAHVLYLDYESSLYPFYLAITITLLSFALARQLHSPVARVLTRLGRRSLFIYVVQYAVVETVPYLAGVTGKLSPVGWVGLCAFAMLVVPIASLAWKPGR